MYENQEIGILINLLISITGFRVQRENGGERERKIERERGSERERSLERLPKDHRG